MVVKTVSEFIDGLRVNLPEDRRSIWYCINYRHCCWRYNSNSKAFADYAVGAALGGAGLLTAGAGVGLNYWARKHFKPNDFSSEDVEAAIDQFQSKRHDTQDLVRGLNVKYNPNTKQWDYIPSIL